MKVALIGASGFVGSAILNELSTRQYDVTAIARNTSKIEANDHIKLSQVDVNDVDSLTEVLKDNDVVISAFNAGWTNPNVYEDFKKGAKSINEAVKKAGDKRLIIVGGAGSLYVDENTRLIDTPNFPAEIKAGAMGATELLDEVKKEKDLDWTFFSPAIEMHQGTSGVRTGKYRTGLDNPVFDESGRSVLSVEDVAVAIVDEVENKKFVHQRFTAGY